MTIATGSLQCELAPLWTTKLGRIDLTARLRSPGGGEFRTRVEGDQVVLEGCTIVHASGRLARPSTL